MKFKKWENQSGIIIIILIFLISKLFSLFYYKRLLWDSAVYIGIGKYIYSLGNSGLWEYTRPILWPLIIGFFWKIGLNEILTARIAEIFISAFCIIFTYYIGKKIFNQKTGLIAALLLAVSPTFFYFSGMLLSELISTFFSLAAVYSFLRKRYFITGVFFGLAFMTRFLQLLIFISLVLSIFLYNFKFSKEKCSKEYLKMLLSISVGFVLSILPFLILNQILYSNLLFPFTQQYELSINSGWLNYMPINFYFLRMFRESPLYLLFVPALFYIFKNLTRYKLFIVLIFIITFSFFNLITQKEMRFLIILLPFMYLIISYFMVVIRGKIKGTYFKYIYFLILIFSISISVITTIKYYKDESSYINKYSNIQSMVGNAYGNIWISNPLIITNNDNKATNLMYYPYFSNNKKEELVNENPDFVFMDTCDLACKQNDHECEIYKIELISHFRENFNITYSNEYNGCSQFVFTKLKN